MLRRIAAATALATVALAAPASAASVTGGATSLTFENSTLQALTKSGFKVGTVLPVKVRGAKVTFPVSGGEVTPGPLKGRVDHSGGLSFAKGKTKVRITEFRVRAGKRITLSGLVGGKRLTILALDATKAKARGTDTNTFVRGIRARLTAGAAKALNAAFKTKVFAGGLPVGTVNTRLRF